MLTWKHVKEMPREGAWRGRRAGRRGLIWHLLPLLLAKGVVEGCTYGGAFSSADSELTIKGATQLAWGGILFGSRNTSRTGPWEGRTPCGAGVPTSQEARICGGEQHIEPSNMSRLVAEGCTQLHWGASLIGIRSLRGSVKGCTRPCWGATLSLLCDYGQRVRTELSGFSGRTLCEGWTPCGGTTSWGAH